jgi:hypothetical protein
MRAVNYLDTKRQTCGGMCYIYVIHECSEFIILEVRRAEQVGLLFKKIHECNRFSTFFMKLDE